MQFTLILLRYLKINVKNLVVWKFAYKILPLEETTVSYE